ncbi:MAG: hypothetical protein AB8G86_03460 [Saprospiraceae bacterium]
MSKSTKPKKYKEDPPPIFKSWNQMYAFVLVLHIIIVTLFYLMTEAYS